MEFPSQQDCYAAISTLSEYYMEGEQLEKWRLIIETGLNEERFPPGKGFLYEIEKVMKASSKPEIQDKQKLHEVICMVCI